MKGYYYDDHFGRYLPECWIVVLNSILPRVNYVEITCLSSRESIPTALLRAEVPLPDNIRRVYAATHRFRLTPEVAAFFFDKPYQYFDSPTFEDPAFYQDDTLILGTISHEDHVILLLTESERQQLNQQGLDFWCEWNFN